MAATFSKGDVVEMKSGGPRMTVVDVEGGGTVHCAWFDGSDQRKDSFDAETLKSASKRGPAVVSLGRA
jgi:uncharacterized protein YodC (DUF2158 family)